MKESMSALNKLIHDNSNLSSYECPSFHQTDSKGKNKRKRGN